jgi:iron complex outermembrane recepter protein
MMPTVLRAARWIQVGVVSAVACSTAAAQASPCPALVRDSVREWSAPLNRVVTLRDTGLSLRTALDLLAVRAGIRLSYSSDAIPLDREACTLRGSRMLGEALSELLHGIPVTPTSSGGVQVVLAPNRPSDESVSARTATLDRVVVTGTPNGGAQRSLPYAIDVVEGRDLRGGATPSLAQALNGQIPGLWIWGDSPTSLQTRFASVRGASSFGISAPKVFVDGIELANPLLLTRISADAIDRIEVIRGPQGASLYGADAISGVVNIQLRHDGPKEGRSDAQIRSSAGAAQSDFANAGVLTQEHSLALRAGRAERSVGAVFGFSSTGAIVPGGGSSQFSVDASARQVTSRTIYSGTARLWLARADAPVNPALSQLEATIPDAIALQQQDAQSVSHYTVGGTITHSPHSTWTNTVTGGVDGYRLRALGVDAAAVPSALDSALRATNGGADKATLRASSVRRVPVGTSSVATITMAGDAALLRDATTSAFAEPPQTSGSGNGRVPLNESGARWLSTIGFGVQGALQIRESIFLTAGLRSERNDGFTDASRFAFLPSVGASVVKQTGDVTWKTRVAYGAGVRPARNPMRETAWRAYGSGGVAAALRPERQAGVEAGIDLFWKRNLSLQVTRFDQRASSLIQQIPTVWIGDSAGGRNYNRPPRYGYALVNLGAITNRGWEFALRQSVGSLALIGTMSLVESRVDQVAPGYVGDLREGDRTLAVPSRTAGAMLTWTPARWQLQLGATHVADWINYDRLALASTYLAGGAPSRALSGETLRQYWTRYDAVTRLRVSVSHDLTRYLSMRMIGDNLLNQQVGEPDNVTIMPGAALSFGIVARF